MPFQAFTLRVADEPNGLSTALAMYYMPGRKAHVIGRGVSLDELPFETVSTAATDVHSELRMPGCRTWRHSIRAGCWLPADGAAEHDRRDFVSLQPDISLPGLRSHDARAIRAADGIRGRRSTCGLTADPQRARLDREMYINFLVNPFLPAGVKPQRLVLRWGTGRRGEVVVGERQWFSLPVGSNDWSGNRLWTVPVAIDFPDGRTILFQEVALTESPRGQVAEMVQGGALDDDVRAQFANDLCRACAREAA